MCSVTRSASVGVDIEQLPLGYEVRVADLRIQPDDFRRAGKVAVQFMSKQMCVAFRLDDVLDKRRARLQNLRAQRLHGVGNGTQGFRGRVVRFRIGHGPDPVNGILYPFADIADHGLDFLRSHGRFVQFVGKHSPGGFRKLYSLRHSRRHNSYIFHRPRAGGRGVQ